MPKFYRSRLIITDVFFSIYDAYVEAISDTLGKMHVIVKNAGSLKSKRRILLKKGHFIESIIFHKNRYYLTDIKILIPFSALCSNIYEVKFLEKILYLISGFLIYPDLAEFNFILETLTLTLKDKKLTIPMATYKFLEFLHLKEYLSNLPLNDNSEKSIRKSLKLLDDFINTMLK